MLGVAGCASSFLDRSTGSSGALVPAGMLIFLLQGRVDRLNSEEKWEKHGLVRSPRNRLDGDEGGAPCFDKRWNPVMTIALRGDVEGSKSLD